MSVTESLQNIQFVVDVGGAKKAVLLDYSDLEDAEEIGRLREAEEEVIPWKQAKGELRAEGLDV